MLLLNLKLPEGVAHLDRSQWLNVDGGAASGLIVYHSAYVPPVFRLDGQDVPT